LTNFFAAIKRLLCHSLQRSERHSTQQKKSVNFLERQR